MVITYTLLIAGAISIAAYSINISLIFSEKLAKFANFLLPLVVPKELVAVRKCHLMPPADDMVLLCVPAIH